MKYLKRKLGLVAISIASLISTSAIAVECPTIPTTPLKPPFVATQAAIDSALLAMQTKVNLDIKKQSDVVTAAVGVLTAQKAMAATQIGKAVENNTQIQSQAEQAVEMESKAREAQEQFGARSQGYNVCGVQAERIQVQKATENTRQAISEMIKNEVTARPGRYASRRTAMAERLALHDALYCTASQAASNLCKTEGSRPGRSIMAATMFTPAPFDSAEYRDKSAFINNMIGLPDDPLDKTQATTPDGVSYMDVKRRKDSINSTALVSLKNLQAMYSGVYSNHLEQTKKDLDPAQSEGKQLAQAGDIAKGKNSAARTGYASGDEDGSGVPLALQIKKDVDKYLGSGDEYKAWSKTLVGQTEKGVLKEVLQIKALRLYLQAQQFDQLSRMEAMLAANVASETYRNGMEGNIENQRNVLMRSNTSAAIKGSPAN